MVRIASALRAASLVVASGLAAGPAVAQGYFQPVGQPVYAPPPVVYQQPAPVYAAPAYGAPAYAAPAYAQPPYAQPPVVYQQAPTYVTAPQVVTQPPAIVAAPPAVVAAPPTVVYPSPGYAYASAKPYRSYKSYGHHHHGHYGNDGYRYRSPSYGRTTYYRSHDSSYGSYGDDVTVIRKPYDSHTSYGSYTSYGAYDRPYYRSYGYRSYGDWRTRSPYGYRYGYGHRGTRYAGGAFLQTGGYANCGSVRYIPYGWTWYRGRDYRC
jgi:hypothetical protein